MRLVLRIVGRVDFAFGDYLRFNVEIGTGLHIRIVVPSSRPISVIDQEIRKILDVQLIQFANVCRILRSNLAVLIVIQARNA